MITMKDFSKDSFANVPLIEVFERLENLVVELLKERDAYREMLKSHFLKSREVSKKEYEKVSGCVVEQEWPMNYRVHETDWEAIDAEAQKIMAGRGGEK